MNEDKIADTIKYSKFIDNIRSSSWNNYLISSLIYSSLLVPFWLDAAKEGKYSTLFKLHRLFIETIVAIPSFYQKGIWWSEGIAILGGVSVTCFIFALSVWTIGRISYISEYFIDNKILSLFISIVLSIIVLYFVFYEGCIMLIPLIPIAFGSVIFYIFFFICAIASNAYQAIEDSLKQFSFLSIINTIILCLIYSKIYEIQEFIKRKCK